MSFCIQGWLFVLVGAFAIAFGGVVTTKGWVLLNNQEQKKAFINAVVREVALNDWELKGNALFTRTDEETLKSRLLYSTLHTSSLNVILRSSLFDLSKAKDDELLTLIRDYEVYVNDFNARLQVSNNLVTTEKDVIIVKKHRRLLVQSNGFKKMLKEQEKVLRFLKDNYSWAFAK